MEVHAVLVKSLTMACLVKGYYRDPLYGHSKFIPESKEMQKSAFRNVTKCYEMYVPKSIRKSFRNIPLFLLLYSVTFRE